MCAEIKQVQRCEVTSEDLEGSGDRMEPCGSSKLAVAAEESLQHSH